MTDKYKNACAEYAKANAEMRRLSRAIGDASYACHEVQAGKWEEEHPGRLNMQDPVNHLKMAYEMATGDSDCGHGYERYFVNHDNDVDGYLKDTCQHCYAAHLAIQERKKAKRAFGIAKRRVTILGNSLLEAAA